MNIYGYMCRYKCMLQLSDVFYQAPLCTDILSQPRLSQSICTNKRLMYCLTTTDGDVLTYYPHPDGGLDVLVPAVVAQQLHQ